jgi:hypothetical protein
VEKTITFELTEKEASILMSVVDVGVKGAGVKVVVALAPIIAKMEAAAHQSTVNEEEPDNAGS